MGTESLPASLRSLAKNARTEQAHWWLWDEDYGSYGPMLAFAHAATPETVLGLLDALRETQTFIERARPLLGMSLGNSLGKQADDLYQTIREALDG